jgi:hypothetical protein
MAQVRECLPSKCKALSSILRTAKKKKKKSERILPLITQLGRGSPWVCTYLNSVMF